MSAAVIATVYGEAEPAGALAIGVRKDGGRYLRHRAGADLAYWRGQIQAALGERMGGAPPWAGACKVDVSFYLARPGGHYGKRGLRPSAPERPTKRSVGDVDKLARAVLDAMTGVVFRDDSQVVELSLHKRYADDGPVRALISARELP